MHARTALRATCLSQFETDQKHAPSGVPPFGSFSMRNWAGGFLGGSCGVPGKVLPFGCCQWRVGEGGSWGVPGGFLGGSPLLRVFNEGIGKVGSWGVPGGVLRGSWGVPPFRVFSMRNWEGGFLTPFGVI